MALRPLALGLAACCTLNLAATRLAPAPKAAAAGVRLNADSAVEDAALLSLGMRRMAADLGLVRLLIYYGTPEEAGVVSEEPGSHPYLDPMHPELAWGGGHYPELASRAERVLDIDPSFTYVAIYAAGALAFNLNRPDQALDVLRYAAARNPGDVELAQYMAAVGFSRTGDKRRVLRLLEPMLSRPDCPTMIKNMVAYLYLSRGDRARAAALYREIAESSRDPGYRGIARMMLRRLEAPAASGR